MQVRIHKSSEGHNTWSGKTSEVFPAVLVDSAKPLRITGTGGSSKSKKK